MQELTPKKVKMEGLSNFFSLIFFLFEKINICSLVCQILDYICKYIKIGVCIYAQIKNLVSISLQIFFACQRVLNKDLGRWSQPTPKSCLQVYRKVCIQSIITVLSLICQIVDYICKYTKIGVCSYAQIKNTFAISLQICSDHFQRVLYKNPKVRLDGANPSPKACLQVYRKVRIQSISTVYSLVCQILANVCKYIKSMHLMKQKFDHYGYHEFFSGQSYI